MTISFDLRRPDVARGRVRRATHEPTRRDVLRVANPADRPGWRDDRADTAGGRRRVPSTSEGVATRGVFVRLPAPVAVRPPRVTWCDDTSGYLASGAGPDRHARRRSSSHGPVTGRRGRAVPACGHDGRPAEEPLGLVGGYLRVRDDGVRTVIRGSDDPVGAWAVGARGDAAMLPETSTRPRTPCRSRPWDRGTAWSPPTSRHAAP